MTQAMTADTCAESRSGHFVFSPVRGRNRAKTRELVQGTAFCTSLGMQTPDPTRTLVADETALLDWLRTAQPGDRFVYHIGHLAADRVRGTTGLTDPQREALCRLADRVLTLVTDDTLTAAQRRRADGHMAYLAIKTSGRKVGRRFP
ncbi:hypothetical protein [Oleisolibacter albus]|uniref:hypothetical protein n=1 Tax=Oleisolibacter albus TaxID=2171757 RepID=UPI0012D81B2A|nr:hypothetical protein [Oleisolibacter albus]